MAKFPPDSFLNLLQRSELFSSDHVEALFEQMQESCVDVQNSSAVSGWMVSNHHLTEWQASKLEQGKHKGFRLGKYRLRDMLGKGGMSSVYLAEHTLMRRECAIKVLPIKKLKDSSYLARFHREAQAVAALDHPNIVRAYDIDHENDKGQEIHFLVMEYVKGRNLYEMIKQNGPLSFEAGAEFCRQAALGLDHAHQAGLVHRDVKPGNLLLDESGTVKILDLGLARFVEAVGVSEASLTVAHEQKVLGTPDYLSPEQALDSHMVDSRADIYSLGCSMYFALTGQPPFNEGSIAQRLMWHQMKEPEEMSKVRPGIPDSLTAIVRKMMAKKPQERYPSMADVASMLLNWLTENAGDEWQREHADVLSLSGPAPTAVPVAPVASVVPTAVPTGREILPAAPVATPVVDSGAPTAQLVPGGNQTTARTGDGVSGDAAELLPPGFTPEESQAGSVFGTDETAEAGGSADTVPSDGVANVRAAADDSGTAVLTVSELAGAAAENVEIVASEGTELVPSDPAPAEEPAFDFHQNEHHSNSAGPDLDHWNPAPAPPDVPMAFPSDPGFSDAGGAEFLQGAVDISAAETADSVVSADEVSVSLSGAPIGQPSAGQTDSLSQVPALSPSSSQSSGPILDAPVQVRPASDSAASATSFVVDTGLNSGSISASRQSATRQKGASPVGLIVGFLVVLAGVGGVFWWQSRDPDAESAGNQQQAAGTTQNQSGSENDGKTTDSPEFLGYSIQVGPDGHFATISDMFAYLRSVRQSYRRSRVIRVEIAGGHYTESISIDNAGDDLPAGILLIADESSPVVLDPPGSQPVVELAELERFQLEGVQIAAAGRDCAIALRGRLNQCSLNKIHVSGYSSTGIRSEGVRGNLGEELHFNEITFNPAGAQAVGMAFRGEAGSAASRIQIDRCRFHGPQKAGIIFEQGAISVGIHGSVIDRAEVGILLGGDGVFWKNFEISNNTLYDCSQAGIRMAAAPESGSFEIGIHRNLFSKLGGAEVVVADGYDLLEFQRFTSSGTGGLQFNWSDRSDSANQKTEWEVVLQPEQRVPDFGFVSTDSDSPDYLSPSVAFPGFRPDNSARGFQNPGAIRRR